jgi:hypothetical protein
MSEKDTIDLIDQTFPYNIIIIFATHDFSISLTQTQFILSRHSPQILPVTDVPPKTIHRGRQSISTVMQVAVIVVSKGGHRFGPVRFRAQIPEPVGPMGVIFRPIPNQFLLGYFRFAG